MDMDTIETRNESGETQVKNTDGSLCEDCKWIGEWNPIFAVIRASPLEQNTTRIISYTTCKISLGPVDIHLVPLFYVTQEGNWSCRIVRILVSVSSSWACWRFCFTWDRLSWLLSH
jgi:hypothetical protein